LDAIYKLLDYGAPLSYRMLPARVTEIVKERVLDTLGCAIAGSSADGCRKLANIIARWGGKKESSLIMHHKKVPAPLAALCNCTMARARELDDVHEAAGTHVSATIVPAAFAVAEYSKALNRPVNGKLFVSAIAFGSDLICRLRMAGREDGPEMGWVGETFAPIAVAAMGAKMLDFTREKTINAVGIAYAQCSCNAQANVEGTFTVSLQQGLGAQAGMLGLAAANEELTGAREVLQGRYGIYPLYLRGNFNREVLLGGLGKRFELANVTTKFYPCCQGNHAAIQAIRELVSEHGIKAENVAQISIHTNTFFSTILGTPDKVLPRNAYDAQFSYYFTAATALVKGTVSLADFTPEGLADRTVLALAKRVRVLPDRKKDKMKALIPPIDVDILTNDNKLYQKTVLLTKGHPDNRAGRADYVKKFDECVQYAVKRLPSGKINAVKEMVGQLESLEDVTCIVEQLT
jgi:2-methylcitrate dehydratase PrpD